MPKSQNRRRYWGYYLQLWFCLHGYEVNAMNVINENVINISIGKVIDITPANIKTLGQYIVLDHLGRGFVRKNEAGYLEGDLLEKWIISDDKRKYEFSLKKDLLWSNGEKITAEEAVNYLNWHKRLGTSNHTNLSFIKDITLINEHKFVINLTEKHESFINSLNNADMALFRLKNDKIDFSVSSGAYILENINDDIIHLKKNSNFPYHNSSADKIVVHNLNQELDKISHFDFIWPLNLTDKDFFKAEAHLKFKRFSPGIVYTHWFSIIPNSKVFNNEHNRILLSYQIRNASKIFYKNNESLSTYADQLLWEDGIGDLPKNEVEEFWKNIETKFKNETTKLKFRVLAADLENIHFVIEQLKELGHDITVDWIRNYQDRVQLMSKYNYDLIYYSNDFSEIDPYESFRVALNPHKPYIYTDTEDKQFSSILDKVLTLPLENRTKEYEKISRKVIEKGYIGLLSKNRQYFLYKNLDLNFWSKTTPEMKFWKTPVIKDASSKKD